MKHLKIYSKQDILSLVTIRRFETKLGERVEVLPGTAPLKNALASSAARYVLFGIPEEIGARANGQAGGTDTGWIPFLQSFLNIQSNDFLDGAEVLLLGHFDFGDVQYLIDATALNADEKTDAYRHAVQAIDEEVEQLVKIITEAKKIPIVIGGGHNNTYPLIKGAAKGWHKAGMIPLAQINCINLDAHAGYRPAEGRHNGNPIRYAEVDGYLLKYCVVGLHENLLPQNVWIDMVNNPFFDCITFEDIFLHEKRTFLQAVAHATDFTADTLCGIDADLDSVNLSLSNALSPAGVTPIHARKFVSYAAADTKPAFLHICGGTTRLPGGASSTDCSTLAAYMVSDFMKGRIEG